MKWIARCSGGRHAPWSILRDGVDKFLVARFDGVFNRRLSLRQIPGETIAVFDPAFLTLRSRLEIGFRDGSRWHYVHHATRKLTGQLSGATGSYDIVHHPGLHASIRHDGRQIAEIVENRLKWGHENVLDVTSDDDVDRDRFAAVLACYLASGPIYQSNNGLFSINFGRLMPGHPPRASGWKPRLGSPATGPGSEDGAS